VLLLLVVKNKGLGARTQSKLCIPVSCRSEWSAVHVVSYESLISSYKYVYLTNNMMLLFF
jgi:hypothetical protein